MKELEKELAEIEARDFQNSLDRYYPKETTADIIRLIEIVRSAHGQLDIAVKALELVATPKRNDGTYNRCREACEELATIALAEIKGLHPVDQQKEEK